jgi:hypothetical protein
LQFFYGRGRSPILRDKPSWSHGDFANCDRGTVADGSRFHVARDSRPVRVGCSFLTDGVGAPSYATNRAGVTETKPSPVRSAIGLTVGANRVLDVVHAIGVCWDGDPDRFTYPTDLEQDSIAY